MASLVGLLAQPLALLSYGLGRHLLFREISRGGWIAVAAVIAIVLLLAFWPRFIAWLERRRYR